MAVGETERVMKSNEQIKKGRRLQEARWLAHHRFPGITMAARDFGVHRVHLHRVLAGQRRDARGLRARYATWKREHGL